MKSIGLSKNESIVNSATGLLETNAINDDSDILVYDNDKNVVRPASLGKELRARSWRKNVSGGDKIARDFAENGLKVFVLIVVI